MSRSAVFVICEPCATALQPRLDLVLNEISQFMFDVFFGEVYNGLISALYNFSWHFSLPLIWRVWNSPITSTSLHSTGSNLIPVAPESTRPFWSTIGSSVRTPSILVIRNSIDPFVNSSDSKTSLVTTQSLTINDQIKRHNTQPSSADFWTEENAWLKVRVSTRNLLVPSPDGHGKDAQQLQSCREGCMIATTLEPGDWGEQLLSTIVVVRGSRWWMPLGWRI